MSNAGSPQLTDLSESSIARADAGKDLASVQQRLYAGSTEPADETAQQKKEPVLTNARERERQRALKEAADVLESSGLQNHHRNLDGFNLLGVVADPRGPGSQFATASALPSSFHGRYGGSDERSTGSGATSYFDASYYYQSLESTLSSVTGQMEALNHVLEDWSRHLLEEGDYAVENEIPESQLKELPAEIENPDVSSLTAYLERSGPKAAAFQQILRTDGHEFDKNLSASSSRSLLTTASDNQVDLIDVSDIPKKFFEIDFDLTDPNTFRELLLIDGGGEMGYTLGAADGSVLDLLPLLPQDALSGYLDKIELALLQQVRSNSDKFFAESQRFALLQEWIQSLLQQVVDLQASTGYLQTDLLNPLETVPVADEQRADLRKLELVLERAEDMLLCKHSLGGVLSAQDDLTAIEQIQYGRQLLNGTWSQQDNGDNSECVELGRLHSFKAASDQLNQYEQLVVSNLRDELVEIFLSWNITSAGGDSSGYGNGSVPASATKASQQEHIRTRVREIISALRTCRALSKTREAYATRLQDVIRMTVRTTVGEFASDIAPTGAVQSVAMGASSMTLNRFMDCLDMLFEQLLALLTSASSVDDFFDAEGLQFQDGESNGNDGHERLRGIAESASDMSNTSVPATPLTSVIATASELSSKSISELLRLRKDAHSLVTLGEMKAIWDLCMAFTLQIERLSGSGNASTLRTTLLAQAKSFVERRHESNMSSLAAALDSERWVQCEVSAGRQAALSRLCSGLSIIVSPMKRGNGADTGETDSALLKRPDLEAEGTRYKVVWSCLLLVEMMLNNIATAAHFPNLASSNVSKVSELLRLFNSRTTQLVLGAGAIHSHAKLKSINAKHLSLVTQCLGMIMAILPHIRAGLMAQLPKKQHTLLTALDQIRNEFGEHNEKVLNKFVTIIGGIVEHGLAKTIPGTDFDARAKSALTANGTVSCCVFLDGVATNTRKMHQVLYSLLPPDHLIDTFSRIFAFIDTRVPALFIAAANIQPVFQKAGSNSPKNMPAKGQPTFSLPKTDEGKRQFLTEVEAMTKSLNSLEGVRAWDFAATNVIERELEYSLDEGPKKLRESDPASEEPIDESVEMEGESARLSTDAGDETPRPDDDKENGSIGTDDEGSPSLSLESVDDEHASPNQSADQSPELSPVNESAVGESVEASSAPTPVDTNTTLGEDAATDMDASQEMDLLPESNGTMGEQNADLASHEPAPESVEEKLGTSDAASPTLDESAPMDNGAEFIEHQP